MPLSLTFLMNVPSHHQLPLAEAFYRLLGTGFKAAFLGPLGAYQREIGWSDAGVDRPFVIRAWESEAARQQMSAAIRQADVVIEGDVSFSLCAERVGAGRLTFRQAERIWKRGLPLLVKRRVLRDVYHHWRRARLPGCHLLAIGAYCAWDLGGAGAYGGRVWRWGYFPAVPGEPPPPRPGDGPPTILWAGRMAGMKRLPVLVEALALLLRRKAPPFRLRLVGDGRHSQQVLARIRQRGLEGLCHRDAWLPVSQVQAEMRRADLFVFPSTYGEGWGAVVNEAMASGCCTVASVGAGSTSWLIEHGRTGYVFADGDVAGLADLLQGLLADPAARRAAGLQAWQQVLSLWGPEVAAERFLELAEGLLGRRPLPRFSAGPCSRDPGLRPAVSPWRQFA
jgi:glycosyltransferase involved in cell wall biosynthesis